MLPVVWKVDFIRFEGLWCLPISFLFLVNSCTEDVTEALIFN